MTFDLGRIRHDAVLMHYSRSSNGSSAPSNASLRATGDTGMVWTPNDPSGGSISYASNSNDVSSANAAGASTLVSRADHVHKGVHQVTSNSSNALVGDVNLTAGAGIALGVAGQSVTVTNIGSTSGGTSVSYASNSNDVGNPSAAGASSLVSRADHVHRGVTSISHTSNTMYGGITFVAEAGIGITSSQPGTVNFRSAGTSTGGSGPTDYVSGPSGSGQIIIPGLYGSPDIRVAATNDDEFDTTDTSDPMTGWTTLGTPASHDINSTAKSHYYVSRAAGAAVNWAGIYKTPPSFPMTATCKLADLHGTSAFNSAGLFVGPSTPGAMDVIAFGAPDTTGPGRIALVNYSSPTAFNTVVVAAIVTGGPPIYLRITVTSTTDVAYYYSIGGFSWHPMTTGRNPSMTIAAVGLVAQSNNASITGEAFFDWIRFT